LAAARLSTRITDVHGARLIDEAQTLGIERFLTAEAPQSSTARPAPVAPPGRQQQTDPFANKGLRAGEVRYPLPLTRLSPGPYLLTFQGSIGPTELRRDIRFEVK
jgi:hypothetical protein